jgi:hypothetical protein
MAVTTIINGDRLLFPEVIKKVACPLFFNLTQDKKKLCG